MKYYLKSTVIPFLYLFFTAITAIGFLGIEKLAGPFKLVILFLNVGILLFIMGAFSFKHGEQAYKDLLANDVERRIMVENNVLRPLKLHEEYRPWKGFVMGALPCIPLVIFMIPHLIVVISGGSYQGFGYIASFLYYSFLAFAEFFGSELTVYSYFWTLVALPVLSLTSGIPYLMGARKARIIEERILEQEKFIYGENK